MQLAQAMVNCRAFLALLLVANFGLTTAFSIYSEDDDAFISYSNETNDGDDAPIKPGDYNRKTVRIVGGSAASINNFPYQLSLRYNGEHMCGASVLNEYYALTAAHCVAGYKAGDFSIYAGSADRISGGTLHQVALTGYHANFRPASLMSDVAFIKVRTPFKLGATIKAVKLPTAELKSGTKVLVSGWGQTVGKNSPVPRSLLYAELSAIDLQTCISVMPFKIDRGQVCAINSGKGACMGDSGGPLVRDGIQYGIVSGVALDANGNCNTQRPSVFADLNVYKYFITKYTSLV